MSAASEAVREAVTNEWQSTREIADIAAFVSAVDVKPSFVYRVLVSDLKYGLVERSPGKRSTLWRRPQ